MPKSYGVQRAEAIRASIESALEEDGYAMVAHHNQHLADALYSLPAVFTDPVNQLQSLARALDKAARFAAAGVAPLPGRVA